MFGTTIIKTLLWDPFPGLLKVFIAYLLVFLIIALFWKLILVLRFKTRASGPGPVSKKSTTSTSTMPLQFILKQANDHYQLALFNAQEKDNKQAIVNATKTIAFLQSALEISSSDVIAKQLNDIPPLDFIQMIQDWIDNELSLNATSNSSSSTQERGYQQQQQQQNSLKNSALTFAQLRAKGPFPSRRP